MSFILDTSSKNKGPESIIGDSLKSLGFKPGRFNEVENRLSDALFKAVNYVEQTWWEKRQIPPKELLREKTGLSKNESDTFWETEDVIESLQRRGLHVEEMIGSDTLLSREQLMVANMILNLSDKSSVREKLKKVGITYQRYQSWQTDPAYMNYIRSRSEQMFQAADSDAYVSIMEGVRDGDFQFTKLFAEIRGIYNPRVTVDVNIEQVLVKIVDIVSRHVDDPEALIAIANEIEALSSKGSKRNVIDLAPVQYSQ